MVFEWLRPLGSTQRHVARCLIELGGIATLANVAESAALTRQTVRNAIAKAPEVFAVEPGAGRRDTVISFAQPVKFSPIGEAQPVKFSSVQPVKFSPIGAQPVKKSPVVLMPNLDAKRIGRDGSVAKGNRNTIRNSVVYKQQTRGVWGKTAEALLAQFPEVCRAFPERDPRWLAFHVAHAAAVGQNPGAYFAMMVSAGTELTDRQKKRVEAVASRLIGGKPVNSDADVVAELSHCPTCGSDRLGACGCSRVQCSRCGQVHKGKLGGKSSKENSGKAVGVAVLKN